MGLESERFRGDAAQQLTDSASPPVRPWARPVSQLILSVLLAIATLGGWLAWAGGFAETDPYALLILDFIVAIKVSTGLCYQQGMAWILTLSGLWIHQGKVSLLDNC